MTSKVRKVNRKLVKEELTENGLTMEEEIKEHIELMREMREFTENLINEENKLQEECRKILNSRSDIKDKYVSFEAYRSDNQYL